MTKKERLIQRGIDPRLYAAWDNMHARCRRHPDYVGRGIVVCARWSTFEAFAIDMGPHPGAGWTLDRERNNENYRRGNCRWATSKTQANNRRDAKNKIPAYKIAAILADAGTCRALGTRYGVSHASIARIKETQQ